MQCQPWLHCSEYFFLSLSFLQEILLRADCTNITLNGNFLTIKIIGIQPKTNVEQSLTTGTSPALANFCGTVAPVVMYVLTGTNRYYIISKYFSPPFFSITKAKKWRKPNKSQNKTAKFSYLQPLLYLTGQEVLSPGLPALCYQSLLTFFCLWLSSSSANALQCHENSVMR